MALSSLLVLRDIPLSPSLHSVELGAILLVNGVCREGICVCSPSRFHCIHVHSGFLLCLCPSFPSFSLIDYIPLASTFLPLEVQELTHRVFPLSSIPFPINSRDLEFSTSHQALRSTHSSCALVLVTTISHSHRAAQDTPGTKNLYCQDSSTSSTSHLSSTTAATCPLLNAVARGNRLDAPCLNSSSLGNEWT